MCHLRGDSEPQRGPRLSSYLVFSPAEFTSSCRPPAREDKLASLQNTQGLVIGYSSLGKFMSEIFQVWAWEEATWEEQGPRSRYVWWIPKMLLNCLEAVGSPSTPLPAVDSPSVERKCQCGWLLGACQLGCWPQAQLFGYWTVTDKSYRHRALSGLSERPREDDRQGKSVTFCGGGALSSQVSTPTYVKTQV